MTMNRCPLWVPGENGKKIPRALMVLPVNTFSHTDSHGPRAPRSQCQGYSDEQVSGASLRCGCGAQEERTDKGANSKTVVHVVQTQAWL